MKFSRKNNFNAGPREEANIIKVGLKVRKQGIGSFAIPNFPSVYFSYFSSYELWTSFKNHLKFYI